MHHHGANTKEAGLPIGVLYTTKLAVHVTVYNNGKAGLAFVHDGFVLLHLGPRPKTSGNTEAPKTEDAREHRETLH